MAIGDMWPRVAPL